MLNLSNNIITYIMSFFGISSVWFTLKTVLAEQLPNIPNLSPETSLIAAIGSFTAALLAALLRQGNTMKNIDENIDRNVAITKKLMDATTELLETQNKIIKKDDEKFETIVNILKKQNTQFETMIDGIRDSADTLEKIVVPNNKPRTIPPSTRRP